MSQLPKTLARYAARIEEYENATADRNGHWVYYRRGWKSGSDPLGVQHQDHENTVRELSRAAADALPCDCADCKEDR